MSTPIFVSKYYRLKALDEIYKIYTYASLGEKNRIENEIMKMYTNKSIVQKRLNKMKEN